MGVLELVLFLFGCLEIEASDQPGLGYLAFQFSDSPKQSQSGRRSGSGRIIWIEAMEGDGWIDDLKSSVC